MIFDLIIKYLIPVISAIISCSSVCWTIYWNKKIRTEDKQHSKELEKYNKEINTNQKEYTEKTDKKKELLKHLSTFSQLSYSILNTCIMCLHLEEHYLRNRIDQKNPKTELIKYVYSLKKDINVLQTNISYLNIFLADVNSAVTTGSVYNNLYFLVELLEDITLKKIPNKDYEIKEQKIILQKALKSSNELKKDLNMLWQIYLKKLAEYYNEMNLSQNIYVTGTNLFNWYFPEYPFEVKGLAIKESDTENIVLNEFISKLYNLKSTSEK